MNVRNRLEIQADKIKDIFPKMSDANSKSEEEKKIQKAFISDTQQRLAEIYGLIEREISNHDLDLSYAEAVNKFPTRIKFILKTVSILALAIKTKLNAPVFNKLFSAQYLKRIDEVCLECYKLNLILSGESDPTANQTYAKGIQSNLKYEYEDYKTNYKKTISQGSMPGQLLGFPICTAEAFSMYQTMITAARERLDQQYEVPSLENRTYFKFSTNNSLKEKAVEYRNPKSLVQITVNYLIGNRSSFFEKLRVLPESITDKFPELDVDYKHKFCLKIKKLIKGISFTPNEKEQKYLDKLISALDEVNPYNAIHSVLGEIGKINKQAYLSTFKDHMQPIRDDIIKLMKEYNSGKEEYVKHFGKAL